MVELKDLIVVPNIAERLKIPSKTDKKLGPNKNAWREFHQAFGHLIRNCLALGHQLDELVKNGFLKGYLVESQGAQDSTTSREIRGMRYLCMVISTPLLGDSQEEGARPLSERSMPER